MILVKWELWTVKHGRKKEKIKKSSPQYIIKTSKRK